MKKCCKCKIEKPLEEFSKDKRAKDGKQGRCKACNKAHYEANKELALERMKAYYESNKEGMVEYQKAYKRKRRKTDSLFKLKTNLSNRTYQAFKQGGYRKNTKTQEMLGVDWEVAFAHIERQFKKGMSWDNHGLWHIDHIVPLSTAKTEEELKKLCHYSNLQPLWGKDNISKSGNIEHGTQSKLRI